MNLKRISILFACTPFLTFAATSDSDGDDWVMVDDRRQSPVLALSADDALRPTETMTVGDPKLKKKRKSQNKNVKLKKKREKEEQQKQAAAKAAAGD